MPAHAEISDIVEEDNRCGGLRIDWFAEERADDDLRSSRFTDDAAAKMIEFALKALEPAWQISCSEIRSTCNDDARRLPFRVGVNYFYPSLQHHVLIVTHIVYDIGYIYVKCLQKYFGELELECHMQVYSFVFVSVGANEEKNYSNSIDPN